MGDETVGCFVGLHHQSLTCHSPSSHPSFAPRNTHTHTPSPTLQEAFKAAAAASAARSQEMEALYESGSGSPIAFSAPAPEHEHLKNAILRAEDHSGHVVRARFVEKKKTHEHTQQGSFFIYSNAAHRAQT